MLTCYKVMSTEPGGVLRAQFIDLLLIMEEIAEWDNGMRLSYLEQQLTGTSG